MQNDRLLYRVLLAAIMLLLIVAAALPAVMQENNGTVSRIPNDAFELTGILESINSQEIVVDGIPVDIRIANLNTRLTFGNPVRVEGSLSEGVFTAREVRPVTSSDPAVAGGSSSNEASGLDDDNFELRGIIDLIDDGFIVISGQQVATPTTATVRVPFASGQLVKVEGRLVSGIFSARDIVGPNAAGFFDDDDDDDDIFDDDLTITADCVVGAPAGWVSYSIRPGDTLSSIASRSGSRVEELVRVNCLSNPRFIVAGTSLLLPRIPTSFPVSNRGNESSGSISRNLPNNSGSGNESSGSVSQNLPRTSSGGNESSGSNSSSSSASNN